jgi:hypothetical protein
MAIAPTNSALTSRLALHFSRRKISNSRFSISFRNRFFWRSRLPLVDDFVFQEEEMGLPEEVCLL